ncbi:type I-E CRISPR-associated protein Cas6/Cse3/CasE [Streptomyces sp. NPDC001546]|uniref:type I-E CRISPR-associated protein Cas6/Cse3/CasE n=1 Tax=Streptomyces sp. NPDC001546 TaxID=3364585 RepID=UPI0036CB8CA4
MTDRAVTAPAQLDDLGLELRRERAPRTRLPLPHALHDEHHPSGAQAPDLRCPSKRSKPTQTLTAGQPHTLLVQTPSPPDWTTHHNTGLITHATTQEVHQTWTTGDTVEIRTIASPLVTKNNDDRKRSRVPLKHPAQCGTWLQERLTKAGCQLAPHDISIGAPETTHQRGQTLTLRQFHATATIHDPHAFTHLLSTGLGHNRAWGAGLVLARKTAKQ